MQGLSLRLQSPLPRGDADKRLGRKPGSKSRKAARRVEFDPFARFPPMTVPRFIHLRLHSEYSIQDSILRIDDAIRLAKQDAMPALALTDLGNVFGLVKFYSGARKKGVKPIAGCDVWVAPPESSDKPTRMLLLVQDTLGWRNLCAVLTRAYRSNMRVGLSTDSGGATQTSQPAIGLSPFLRAPE